MTSAHGVPIAMPLIYTLVLLIVSLVTSTTNALPTISVKGAKLFANGQQFFIKGVAYQGSPSDPLTDVAQCYADASLMATLGTNSIRVYHVSPYVDHGGCMSAFAAFGIYVWLDLDTFNTTISQEAPAWTASQLGAFGQVIDAFAAFSNLAGFWIGNEVINTAAGSSAAPYIKAAVADVKAYMGLKQYRAIPIGYSAADIAELRPALQNYLACSSAASTAGPAPNIDFFGLNSYEWCGDGATYVTSGYAALQAMSANYSLPLFFSETGCNAPRPRAFADQSAIFGPAMSGTWSGSIIYEWVQETNSYGLVTYPGGTGTVSGPPQPLQPDFANLAAQWKTVAPAGVAEAAYTPTLDPPPCPLSSAGWYVDGHAPLPTLGTAVVSAVAASALLPAASAAAASPSTWTSFPPLVVTNTVGGALTTVTALAGAASTSGGGSGAVAEASSTATSSRSGAGGRVRGCGSGVEVLVICCVIVVAAGGGAGWV